MLGQDMNPLNLIAPPPKKILAKPKQAGKKKKGCGENEFLPARRAAISRGSARNEF